MTTIPTRALPVVTLLAFATAAFGQSPFPPKPARLGTPIRAHENAIVAIDWSADGAQVLTASLGGDIHVWDARTGKRLSGFQFQGLLLSAVLCGAKNERIAVADLDGTQTFDTRTGKPGPKWPGLLRIATTPDQATLVAVTKAGEVVFADAMTGKKAATVKVGSELAHPKFSSDGSMLLVDEVGGGVAFVVDRAAAKVTGKIEHGDNKMSFAFLPDGKAVMGHSRKMVRKLAVPGGEQLGEWEVPLGVTGMTVIGNGESIVFSEVNGAITHYDLAAGAALHRFHEDPNLINRMVVSSDGTVLASGGFDSVLRFWSLATGEQLFAGEDHDNVVTAIAVSPDGTLVASGCMDNSTILWGSDGKRVAKLRVQKYMITAAEVAPDGTWWSASQDRTIRRWNAKGEQLASLQLQEKRARPCDFQTVDDGKRMVVAAADGTVRWLDVASGNETQCWRGHDSKVLAVVADASGEFVASVEEDGKAIVWDAATGAPRHAVTVHLSGANSLCHAGEGVVIASGAKGSLVRFDGKTGKETHRVTFGGAQEPRDLGALAFVAGSSLVVAAAGDKLCVFAAADLAAKGEHAAPCAIASLAASADGTVVAAGLADGTVAVWKLVAAAAAKR